MCYVLLCGELGCVQCWVSLCQFGLGVELCQVYSCVRLRTWVTRCVHVGLGVELGWVKYRDLGQVQRWVRFTVWLGSKLGEMYSCRCTVYCSANFTIAWITAIGPDRKLARSCIWYSAKK